MQIHAFSSPNILDFMLYQFIWIDIGKAHNLLIMLSPLFPVPFLNDVDSFLLCATARGSAWARTQAAQVLLGFLVVRA